MPEDVKAVMREHLLRNDEQLGDITVEDAEFEIDMLDDESVEENKEAKKLELL